MKTITFLRHAKADSSGNLSLEGMNQAQNRASLLPIQKIDLLITSTTSRTCQTGTIILEKLGLTTPHIITKEINIPLRPHYSYYNEAKDKLLELIALHKSSHILVISHDGVLNQLGLMFDQNNSILNSIFFSYTEGFMLDFRAKEPSILIIK